MCIYDLHIRIYGDIYPCAQLTLHTYTYMQHKTLEYRMQATDTAVNCSQHGITKYQSPPQATAGFYQGTP